MSNRLWQGNHGHHRFPTACDVRRKDTSKRRILFEALICGSLSLVASSLIEWMAWPSSLSVAGVGSIGILGVTAIRELVTRFIGRKVDAA